MSSINEKPEIDFERLGRESNRARMDRSVSVEVLGNIIDASGSTVSRLESSSTPMDIDNIVRLCHWLNIPFESFITTNKDKIIFYPDCSFIIKLGLILNYDKSLTKKHREALLDIMKIAYENFII